MSWRARGGFSAKVIALELALLVAWLLVPAFQRAALRQRAGQAANEIRIVCAAASTVHALDGHWPEDAPAGVVPASLTSRLPVGVGFVRRGYVLDWDRWALRDGIDPESNSGQFAGVSVRASDPRLLRLLADLDRACLTVGGRRTYVLENSPSPPEPGLR